MENEEFENKDNEQLVRKVLNKKFDTVKGKTNKKEWNVLMEESNKDVKKQASHTRMYAVAASVALLLAVGGSVIAVINNKDGKNLSTTDKKPKKNNPQETSTTTTIPLTEEQTLLKDTVTLNREFVGSAPSDGGPQDSILHLVDNDSGKEITAFAEGTKDLFDPEVTDFANGMLSVTSRVSFSCDPVDTKIFDIAKGQFISSNETRSYSPNKIKYAQIRPIGDCENSGDGSAGSNLVIVDVETKKERVIKPESYKSEYLPEDTKIYVGEFRWINDDEMLLGTHLTKTNGVTWSKADLNQTISLNNVKTIEKIVPSYSDGYLVLDTKTIGNNSYVLIADNTADIAKFVLKDLNSGNVLWTKSFGAPISYEHILKIGSNPNVAYGFVNTGSMSPSNNDQALIFNAESGNIFKPAGNLILPKN